MQEGGKVSESTEKEDKFYHIDIKWESPKGKKGTFDVKGMKKPKRNYNYVQDKTTWVEIKNIHGNEGWLYGKQDYISFEMFDKWVIVRRNNFCKKCEESITDKNIYHECPSECFKLYQRDGRKDVIMMVPMSFVLKNACKIINKSDS